MTKFTKIFLFEAGALFLILFVLLSIVFGGEGKGAIKKRRSLFASFSAKTIGYMLLASASITYCVFQFAGSGFTASLIFVATMGLSPILINNMRKRTMQEAVFSDVILYCQNAAMLLKQTHNVYSSVAKAAEDLTTELRDDLSGLLTAFQQGREEVITAMGVLERNFPYSCIKNLDVILLHMFYENANVDDSLLVTYQDDVTSLEQDVRKNKEKRKALRMSYIVISVGSVLAYLWFVLSIKDTFGEGFNSELYRILNMLYSFAALLSFFFVDRYFNLNTTKE